MALLVLTTLFPAPAGVLDCTQAAGRIGGVVAAKARPSLDSLRTTLEPATFARHGVEASDEQRARSLLSRLHFHARAGDVLGMVMDFAEAKHYASVLDSTHRAALYLYGAQAYRAVDEYAVALELISRSGALVRQPRTREDSLVLARTIHAEAETKLRLGTRLDDVAEGLRTAVVLYRGLGDTALVATATTLLGETYAAAGDTAAALAETASAVQLAKRSGAVRGTVAALYRQGVLLREAGDLEAAGRSLREALDASAVFQAFTARILYQLGRLHELRREFEKAAGLYQMVIDAPKPRIADGELEAERQASKGIIRIQQAEQGQTRGRQYLMLACLFLMAGFVLYFFYRRRVLVGRLRKALYLPENLPTGERLEHLERRFQRAVGSELLGSRLARLYAVLFDSPLVLSYIEDPILVRQVRKERVGNNTALFLCAAAVEEAIQGRTFRNNPANTLGSYLRGEFKKRNWDWPKHPYAWKQHFVEHHVSTIF